MSEMKTGSSGEQHPDNSGLRISLETVGVGWMTQNIITLTSHAGLLEGTRPQTAPIFFYFSIFLLCLSSFLSFLLHCSSVNWM